MSATYNSNFLSNFGGNILPALDILSSVSSSILIDTTSSGTYYARYFYIGNLLIQFSDFSSGIPPTYGSSTENTLTFPIAYDTTPYTVILTPSSSAGSSWNIYISLIEITNLNFRFHVGNNDGTTGFIAIGPRPGS
jgi:hypothetical protein